MFVLKTNNDLIYFSGSLENDREIEKGLYICFFSPQILNIAALNTFYRELKKKYIWKS